MVKVRVYGMLLESMLLALLGTQVNGRLSLLRWSMLNDFRIGQVASVTFDNDGNLVIFHRGDRIWDDRIDEFARSGNALPAIPIDTILVINKRDSSTMYQWGSNRFIMPHGAYVDPDNFLWLTDAYSHQVHKYYLNGTRVWTSGSSFVRGSDKKHFCSPTDAAFFRGVNSTGSFVGLIADGYCNQRIVVVDPESGRILSAIELKGKLNVLHSIAILPSNPAMVCMADRNNQRVLCFEIIQTSNKAQLDMDKPRELVFDKPVYSIRKRQSDQFIVLTSNSKTCSVFSVGDLRSPVPSIMRLFALPFGAHSMTDQRSSSIVVGAITHGDLYQITYGR